jgi:carbonic anhydrase
MRSELNWEVILQGRAFDMDPFDLNTILPEDKSYYTYIGSLVRIQSPPWMSEAISFSFLYVQQHTWSNKHGYICFMVA